MNISMVETIALYKGALKRHNPGSFLRKAARVYGPLNPIGDGDSKTQTPGTYRPVGPTCPDSCPRLIDEDCYALGGNVGIHQRRALVELEAAFRSAEVVFIWAVQTYRWARLHVSGGFGKEDETELRQTYVDGLCELANRVNRLAGRPIGTDIAWTYTHLPGVTFDTPWIAQLRASGIHVRISDHVGPNGAIVGDHSQFKGIRAKLKPLGLKPVKCLAQVGDYSCRTCGICWERPELVVVFHPEGMRKARLLRQLRGSEA
jgi:hypothetical protein